MTLIFADMRSEGEVVPAKAQVMAFLSWARHETLRYSALAGEIGRALPNAWPGAIHRGHRAADRLVQRLRKAGWIEHQGGGVWSLTDRGRNGVEGLEQDRSRRASCPRDISGDPRFRE